MGSRDPELDDILSRFRSEGGVHLISARSRNYAGEAAEAGYATQFQVGDDYVASERLGILKMLGEVGADRSGPALEIGCGTGIFSRPLVHSDAYPSYLVTDASMEFVRMARAFVARPLPGLPPADETRVRYGLLLEDGLALLPGGRFSLVALRYVLHHILDWSGFIRDTARLLRPGGVLTFEEPCVEGFLLQAMLGSTLATLLQAEGIHASAAAQPGLKAGLRRLRRSLGLADATIAQAEERMRGQLGYFLDTIEFYNRRDVDKSQAEDKHLFRVDEVMRVGRENGLTVDFFPNTGYETLAAPQPAIEFETEFFHNLRTNFGFGEPIVDFARRALEPQLALIRRISAGGNRPYTKGVFACRRVA